MKSLKTLPTMLVASSMAAALLGSLPADAVASAASAVSSTPSSLPSSSSSASTAGGSASASPMADSKAASTVTEATYEEAPDKLQWKFDANYFDPISGRSYYRAFAHEGDDYMSREIYQEKDGSWHSLEAGSGTYWDGYWNKPRWVSTSFGYPESTPFRILYDPSSDSAVRSVFFAGAASDKYGLVEGENPAAGISTLRTYKLEKDNMGNRFHRVYFKMLYRAPSGIIRELGEVPFRPTFQPMPDGGMLGVLYNTAARMNEIVRFDPATAKMTSIVLASLDVYDSQKDLLLIRYNKPDRPAAVFDLKKGSARPATESDFKTMLNRQSEPVYKQAAKPASMPPAELQPQDLPVTATTITTTTLARAVISGSSIDLPFAFILGGRTMLPVKELAELLPLKIEQHKQPGRAEEGWFSLTGPAGSTRTDSASSMLIGDRLYVSSELLRGIGLPLESIDWKPSSD